MHKYYAARERYNNAECLFIGIFIAIFNKIPPCSVQYQTLCYCCYLLRIVSNSWEPEIFGSRGTLVVK